MGFRLSLTKLYFMLEWSDLKLLKFFSFASFLWNMIITCPIILHELGRVNYCRDTRPLFAWIKAPRERNRRGSETHSRLLRSKETCAKRKVNSSTGTSSFPKHIISFSVSFSLSQFFTYRFFARRAHIENRLQHRTGQPLPHAEHLYELQ